jgi:hypothetical protein
VWVDDDDATAKAFALADNRTAELGGYDDQALAALIAEIQAADAELFAATGWSDADLTDLLGKLEAAADPPDPDDDDVPENAPAITVAGDLWILGPHRLLCGDARDTTDVDRVVAGATVNIAFTSPPYADRRKYDETTTFRPIPPDDYVEWFAPVAANVAAHLTGDGSWFVNIKPGAEGLDTELYVLDLVAAHVRQWGWHFATEFCWERNGVPKQPVLRVKNQFEPVYQFARDRWKFRPDHVRHPTDDAILSLGAGSGDTSWSERQGKAGVIPPERRAKKARSSGTFTRHQGQPGDIVEPHQRVRHHAKSNGGRSMPDSQGSGESLGVARMEGFAYPGNRLPTFTGTHTALGHAAAFPVGLPGWFIKAFTDPGDVVYEPFAGSGSTIIAAEKESRVCVAVEISPAYCDIICRRYQELTGTKPILEATGEPKDFSAGG